MWAIPLLSSTVLFIVFKYCYPSANFMPDSYPYMEAAALNADVNMWPVGYSKFLRLVSVFSHSDLVLVTIQFLYLKIATFAFLLTIIHLVQPRRLIKNLLLVIAAVEPLSLYLANYISADALFTATSLCWFSTLLWLHFRPRVYLLPLHAFFLLGCFVLRYNAIFYPVISVVTLWFSRSSLRFRLSGFVLILVPITYSYLFTVSETRQQTDVSTYSPFAGWQLANNALTMYEHIPDERRAPAPPALATFDSFVLRHLDTLDRVRKTEGDSLAGIFYLWNAHGPLVAYMNQRFKDDTTSSLYKKWAKMSVLYGQYGRFLVRRYPLSYVQFYLLPNAIRYVLPAPEFLLTYNLGADSVKPIGRSWFQLYPGKVSHRFDPFLQRKAVRWYTLGSLLINLSELLLVLSLVMFRTTPLPKTLRSMAMLTAVFWLLNALFSIAASPVVLRYQYFPLLISLTVQCIYFETLYRFQDKQTPILKPAI